MTVQTSTSERYTYSDYCQWPEDEHWELIDGVAYNMSPTPTRRHQDVVGELFRQIANYLADKPCSVYVAPFDIRLPKRSEPDDQINTVVQPDISVIRDMNKLDDRGCRGAPDWVIEVLSSSSATKDHLQEIYQRAGVKEYWLVHPTDRIVTIYKQDKDAGRLTGPTIREASRHSQVGILPELSIDWTMVFVQSLDFFIQQQRTLKTIAYVFRGNGQTSESPPA